MPANNGLLLGTLRLLWPFSNFIIMPCAPRLDAPGVLHHVMAPWDHAEDHISRRLRGAYQGLGQGWRVSCRKGRSSGISVICVIPVIPAPFPGGMRVSSPPLARCFGWKR